MATTMHRLQISLPQWQHQFLVQRARRDGVSVAEVIRSLIEREADTRERSGTEDSVMSIAGIAEDSGPLIDGIPVSRAPHLYVAESARPRDRAAPEGKAGGRAKRRSGR